MRSTLILVLITLLISACKDDDSLPDQGLELVWEYQYNDKLDFGTRLPQVGLNEVLFFRDGETLQDNDYLMSFSKLTGELNWQWTDGINSSNNTSGNNKGVFINNVFYFQNASRFFGVNLNTGEIEIKAITPSEANPLSCAACFLFTYNSSTIYRVAGTSDRGGILSTNPLTGESNLTLNLFDISNPSFVAGGYAFPTIHNTKVGESLLLATGGILDIESKTTPFYFSFNLNDLSIRDSLQLDVTEFNNSVDDMDIYEGKAYIASNRMISCIDIESGTIVWRTDMPGDFLFSKIVVADGKVMGSRSNDFKTVVLDANNGNILWERDLIRANVVNMQYHNGIMYFVASGRLFVVDANNGNILEELQTPSVLQGNASDYFNNAVVDPQSGLLFTQSFTTAYAYKLYR